MIPLSLLDIQWPGHLPDLVPVLDDLGFHRYWASEHHSPRQSASPTLVAALAAGLCERMRVGTAGILLRAAAAMRVAEDFAALELFFPGRVDLGIASAWPGRHYDDAYALDVRMADDEVLRDRTRRLVDLVRSSSGDASGPLAAGPEPAARPQIWICGTGISSARMAAELGTRFAFHEYLARGRVDGAHCIATYRELFQQADELAAPYAAIAAYGACCDQDDVAHVRWQASFGNASPPAPCFVGDPASCADQLLHLVARLGADEVVIDCFAPSFAERLESLSALAAAWMRSQSDASP